MKGGPGFLCDGTGLLAVTGGKRHLHAGGAALAGQRGAQPEAGSDDKGASGHPAILLPFCCRCVSLETLAVKQVSCDRFCLLPGCRCRR